MTKRNVAILLFDDVEVLKLLGGEIAAKTARYMEYNWKATS
jgi:hypothetical protein